MMRTTSLITLFCITLCILCVGGDESLTWKGRTDASASDVPCAFDTIEWKDLDRQNFFTNYFAKAPLVIRNAINDWPAMKTWTKSYFAEMNDIIVHAGSSNGIVGNDGSGPLNYTLAQFVTEDLRNASNGEPYYVFDRTHTSQKSSNLFRMIPELKTHFEVPEYFRNWEYPDKFFLLGKDGSSVGFHKHPDAWNALVHGEKRWFVYPPQWNPTPALLKKFPDLPSMPHTQWFKEVYPILKPRDKPTECVQREGDLIYLPGMWAHATISIGETVGVAHQLSNGMTYVGGGFNAFSHYMHLMGSTLRNYSRCGEAIPFLEDLATEHKEASQIDLAACLAELGETELAQQVYGYVVKNEPLKPEGWIGYAQALAGSDHLIEEAAEAFTVAKKILQRRKMLLEEKIESLKAKEKKEGGKKGKGQGKTGQTSSSNTAAKEDL
eukprot:TRINITY_DN5766_c0_g1_i1.p1 TRINITY_DN5766_c0_g1~~TRINITY_DN5766_c0_g1_i1.p1  ORF type:complete len:437 (-),score=100.21 TRINITY_DN5766_c0_g1_i1:235-1545(-)